MIIETHYLKGKEFLTMDTNEFIVDGVQFRITGTEAREFDETICTVKNLNTGKSVEMDHQHLCRLIQKDQQKTAAKAKAEADAQQAKAAPAR